MTFAENINRICAERGTNLTAVIKQIKMDSLHTRLPSINEVLYQTKRNCLLSPKFCNAL